jgi:hypothetical protein
MSRSLSYKNVSKRRFNCMKSTMRARVHDFARKNNYRITVWQVPDKDSGRWHIKLESSKINKPSLDFYSQCKAQSQQLVDHRPHSYAGFYLYLQRGKRSKCRISQLQRINLIPFHPLGVIAGMPFRNDSPGTSVCPAAYYFVYTGIEYYALA